MSYQVDEPSLTRFGGPNLGRLRRDIVFGAVLLTIAFALIQLYHPAWVEQPLGYFDGPPGYKVYADPLKAWTVAFPDAWHADPYVQRRPGPRGNEASGITITNIEHTFPDEYPTPRIDPALVAVAVRYATPHFVVDCKYDTMLPLNLKNAVQDKLTILDESSGRVKHLSMGFSMGSSVEMWIGSRAPAADIASAEAIVGSINYRRSANGFGQADCSNEIPHM